MASPKYHKTYCMDGHEYSVDLCGITVNDKPVDDFLKTEEHKEIESNYKEELVNKLHRGSIFVKPRWKSKKERNGKTMNVTEEHKNKRLSYNLDKCKYLKDIIISIFLTGKEYTAVELLSFILSRDCTDHSHSRTVIGKTQINLKRIQNILYQLSKTPFIDLVRITKKINKETNRYQYIYRMEDTNISLEDAIDLTLLKRDLPKSTIKKAVKNAKDQRLNQEIIAKIAEIVFAQVDYKFKDVIESLAKEIQETKQILNQLMIDTPASNLKKSFGIDSNKLEVEVKGGVDINFKFLS